jgi:hypothetical protein
MSIADQARPSFASYLAGPACGINARNEHCPFPRKTRMALTLRPTGMSSPASKREPARESRRSGKTTVTRGRTLHEENFRRRRRTGADDGP